MPRLLLLCGLPAVAWLSLHNAALPAALTTLAPAVAGVVGLMAPDWILGRRRRRYLGKLEIGLPDALDMMVICAQAGLALGPAIVRVATELASAHWEVAQELAQTANELQMVSDSRIALVNLGTRTGHRRLQASWHHADPDHAVRHAADGSAPHPVGARCGRTRWSNSRHGRRVCLSC